MRRNSGAAKDGSVKVFIVARVIFERRKPKNNAAVQRPGRDQQRFLHRRALFGRSKPLLVRQAKYQWRSTRKGRARNGRGKRSLSGAKKMCAAARGDPDASPPTRLPLGDT